MSDGAARWSSRLPRAQRCANALGVGLLAIAIALRPASAPVLVALALPLALALFAGRRGAGLAARGWALGANVFVLLGCALLLLVATVRFAQGGMETADGLRAAVLFASEGILCVFNVRALGGP